MISSWQDLANCVSESPDLFFHDDEDAGEFDFSNAYTFCFPCKVRRQCLMAGLSGREYRYGGMWGGAEPAQLKRIARHSRHGRAPLICERCGTDRDFIKVTDEGWKYCCGSRSEP